MGRLVEIREHTASHTLQSCVSCFGVNIFRCSTRVPLGDELLVLEVDAAFECYDARLW